MTINTTIVRTRDELIKGLLKRAFNGESRFTVAELKAEIDARLARAGEMPAGHKALLDLIRGVEKENRDYTESLRAAGVAEKDIPPESRALRNLTIRERMNGKANISYQMVSPLTPRICDDVQKEVYIERARLLSLYY